MARGRHIRRKRFGVVAALAVVAASVLLAAGGGAYAAYRYEQDRADVILPGVRVAGIEVGEMTRREAMRSVRSAAGEQLDRSLTIRVGDRAWKMTAAELGERAAIASAVDEALGVNATLGTFDRFWHRVRDESVAVEVDLAFRTRGDAVDQLASEIAAEVFEPWVNASISLTDDDDRLVFNEARAGTKLPVAEAADTIRAAIDEGVARVDLRTIRVPAKTTARSMGPTVVVDVSTNRLHLFEGFDRVKSWDVATAKPGWVTPTGVWNIWDMREDPTWYNPALDTWGASLPAIVPGGPSNPMGTRAIYIDAPGLIRIHGTTSPPSIGRYASHGCIRMHNGEIERLFEMIPVGAKVVIVGHRPAGAAEWDTPASSDI